MRVLFMVMLSLSIMINIVASQPLVNPVTLSLLKERVYESFVGTRVEGRIVRVDVLIRRGKNHKLRIMWHPLKTENIFVDMVTILEVVNKTIPNFSSVYLQAIHPEYMRWSKYIIWDATITKKEFLRLQQTHADKAVLRNPQPLF